VGVPDAKAEPSRKTRGGRRRHLVIAVLAATAGLVLAAGYVVRRGSGTVVPGRGGAGGKLESLTYSEYLEATGGAGVAPRTYSAANETLRAFDGGWLVGGRVEAANAAEAPIDVDVLAANDPTSWRPLQEWKMQHGGVTEFGLARQRCMLEKLKGRLEGRPCDNKLTVVLERGEGGREGRVVYVRAQLPEDATEGCREYSECVAKGAWIGRVAPLPPGDEAFVAIHSGDLLFPFEGSEDERRRMLEADINSMRAQLKTLEDTGDPAVAMNIALLTDMIAFHQWALEQ